MTSADVFSGFMGLTVVFARRNEMVLKRSMLAPIRAIVPATTMRMGSRNPSDGPANETVHIAPAMTSRAAGGGILSSTACMSRKMRHNVGVQRRPKAVRWNNWLCRCFTGHFPARKDQHSRVTPQGAGQDLRTLNAKTNPTILDCGDGGLRNPRCLSQLILAQFLKLAKYAHRLTNRYGCALLRRAVVFHHGLR